MKKKVIVFLGVFTLIAGSLAGCGKKTEQADVSGTNEPAHEEPAIEFTDEEENPVGMGNPWVEIAEEEANGLCFRLFKAPEGATGQSWLKCEALGDPDKAINPMVQLNFRLNDMDFTARAQQGAAEDADISGIYAEWTVGPEDVTLANWGEGNMAGKTYRAVSDTETTDLITWYDIEIGIKYSLSVTAADLDGYDIQAVAEQMYPGENETYGDIPDAPEEEENADGFYGSYLKSSDENKIGTTDENGLLYKVVYRAVFVEDKLYLSGSMDYRNSKDQDAISVSDDLTHVFTVNLDTVYQMVGGEDGPETVTYDEFAGYLKDCSDSGLYVEVEVSGGVVKTASISA